jgi:acyl-CoA thioesterase-1
MYKFRAIRPIIAFKGYGPLASLFKRSILFIFILPLFCGSLQAATARKTHPAPKAPPAEFTVLAMGDSLTAGFGLSPKKAFPYQLQIRLRKQGLNVDVKNAGVSGDTTSGGLSRLAWLVEGADPKPDLVILEFGANDALRGIDPSITRANLDSMLGYLTAKKLKVLFVGMKAPPNMGKEFAADFNAIYPDLAQKYRVAFDPFFLDGVAGKPVLNQKDGMHPNADGVMTVINRLAPKVTSLLKEDGSPKNRGK